MTPTLSTMPFVAVTASSAVIDGARRIKVNQSYTDALLAAGLLPLVIPPIGDPERAVHVLDAVQGLVLTGGEDVDPERFGEHAHSTTGAPHAARDACEIALAKEAQRRRIPTLAICRGMQVLNVALGGTLIQDIPSELGTAIAHNPGGDRNARVHRVRIATDSALRDVIGTDSIETNSFHHQALREVASSLRVTASGPDGVIEGVESTDPGWWMIGVQWHPEDLVGTAEAWDRQLFAAFARAVIGAV